MKSTTDQLISRGWIPEAEGSNAPDGSYEYAIGLLNSLQAVERTLGARLLSNHPSIETVQRLCNVLQKEKKLYTTLEISKTLASLGVLAVPQMVALLGCIGNNQHKQMVTDFKKKSYPLPRDLAARILIRIGAEALPNLIAVMQQGTDQQVSEALDAVGFICFYAPSDGIFTEVRSCFDRFEGNELIQWKAVRAMSAFAESASLLTHLLSNSTYTFLHGEIRRSLSLLNRNPGL